MMFPSQCHINISKEILLRYHVNTLFFKRGFKTKNPRSVKTSGIFLNYLSAHILNYFFTLLNSTAAFTKSLNNGCGLSARDFSSGWN